MPDISYRLTVDDVPAPPELLAAIQQIEVEDHAEMADMMRLRISVGGSAGCSGWNVLDEDLFHRLSVITLSIAIGPRPAETLMTAYVTGREAADYSFTSGLPVQLFRSLAPIIGPATARGGGSPVVDTAELTGPMPAAASAVSDSRG